MNEHCLKGLSLSLLVSFEYIELDVEGQECGWVLERQWRSPEGNGSKSGPETRLGGGGKRD